MTFCGAHRLLPIGFIGDIQAHEHGLTASGPNLGFDFLSLGCEDIAKNDLGAFFGKQACFNRAHGYELTIGGRKLMGSAQRRAGEALLQQGSLLVGPGHERLARYARDGDDSGREAALAASAITLAELLGRPPEPEPFRHALARAWQAAAGRPFA